MLYFDSNDKGELIKHSLKLFKKPLYIHMAISAILCVESSYWLILKLIHKKTDDVLFSAFYTALSLIYMTWIWCSFAYEIKEKDMECIK